MKRANIPTCLTSLMSSCLCCVHTFLSGGTRDQIMLIHLRGEYCWTYSGFFPFIPRNTLKIFWHEMFNVKITGEAIAYNDKCTVAFDFMEPHCGICKTMLRFNKEVVSHALRPEDFPFWSNNMLLYFQMLYTYCLYSENCTLCYF